MRVRIPPSLCQKRNSRPTASTATIPTTGQCADIGLPPAACCVLVVPGRSCTPNDRPPTTGADPYVIADIVGHAEVETLSHYAALNEKRLRKAMR